jgi:hypothetical protein
MYNDYLVLSTVVYCCLLLSTVVYCCLLLLVVGFDDGNEKIWLGEWSSYCCREDLFRLGWWVIERGYWKELGGYI